VTPAGPGPDVGDAELVHAWVEHHDRRSVEVLLRRHEPRLRVLCHRMCGAADGEDALQEALVAVVRGLPRFDGRSAFATWAYRVATNACLDELRRRRRRPRPVDEVPDPGLPEDPGALDARDRRDELLAALAELPEEFRAAVVLRDVLDLNYAAIAEVLELAPGTVRSRIARGRARLLTALAPDGATPTADRTIPTADCAPPTGDGVMPGGNQRRVGAVQPPEAT
jgi:RNA polymerase sigma-70 factor (ECF subfamily)